MPKKPQVTPEQLLRIADSVPAAVTVYSVKTTQYLYVNKSVMTVSGYRQEEFLAGGLGFVVSLVHPDDVQELLSKNQEALEKANIRMAKEDEAIATFEYRMLHKNGKYQWIKTVGTVFGRSADGSIELILNISTDISEQKRAEIRWRRELKKLELFQPDDAINGGQEIFDEQEIEF